MLKTLWKRKQIELVDILCRDQVKCATFVLLSDILSWWKWNGMDVQMAIKSQFLKQKVNGSLAFRVILISSTFFRNTVCQCSICLNICTLFQINSNHFYNRVIHFNNCELDILNSQHAIICENNIWKLTIIPFYFEYNLIQFTPIALILYQ
jgi:hypothetical protein